VVLQTPEAEEPPISIGGVWSYNLRNSIKQLRADWVILLVQNKVLHDKVPPFVPASEDGEQHEDLLLYNMPGLSRQWVVDKKGESGFEFGDTGSEVRHATVYHEGTEYFIIRVPTTATETKSIKRGAPDGDADNGGTSGGSGGNPKHPRQEESGGANSSGIGPAGGLSGAGSKRKGDAADSSGGPTKKQIVFSPPAASRG